ncbi:AbgT family transporter, partial [Pantoea agglomerans]|uniref:AbgT family transporter n=1 Tax=Enterobacter agglomerans TaxID=549 RepID=UPI001F5D8BB6
IVPIIILFFFVVAIAYGVVTRQIRRPDDIPQLLVDPMKGIPMSDINKALDHVRAGKANYRVVLKADF